MRTMKGPAIFLAQFMGDAPFDTMENACRWMADAGYKGVQVPSDNPACIDLKLAAESRDYCETLKGQCREWGVEITELSTHIQGQLVAVHPAYDTAFDAFAPAQLHGQPQARQEWAVQQVMYAAKASQNLGLDRSVSFPGALVWPFMYPWPQRPAGLVEEGFKELAKRWRPILDFYDECGVDICFEIHPGEDLHDGVTFERFLDEVDGHARCNILYDPSHFILQQLDYLAFIDHYHDPHPHVSCEGCGVPSEWKKWRLWRLSRLGGTARSLPFTRRRSDRFRGHFQQARWLRLRRLGCGRMGMRFETSGGRRTRRRKVRIGSHHPSHRQGL